MDSYLITIIEVVVWFEFHCIAVVLLPDDLHDLLVVVW